MGKRVDPGHGDVPDGPPRAFPAGRALLDRRRAAGKARLLKIGFPRSGYAPCYRRIRDRSRKRIRATHRFDFIHTESVFA